MGPRESLLSALFSGERGDLINIKFFRGTREVISADDIERSVHSSMAQLRLGTATVTSDLQESDVIHTVDELIAAL